MANDYENYANMRKAIRMFLEAEHFTFDENVFGFTIDCSGNPSDFSRLVLAIAHNIEVWTYDENFIENPININIDCAHETVRIKI